MAELLYHTFKDEYAIGFVHNADQENEQIYTVQKVNFFWNTMKEGLKRDFNNDTFGYDSIDEANISMERMKKQGILFVTKSLKDDIGVERANQIHLELQILTKDGALIPA